MIVFSQSRLAGLGLLILAAMLLPAAASGQCSVPQCPPPQYEQCMVNGSTQEDTTQYLNCLARNRERDNQYQQCESQRKRECEQDEKERQQEEHDRYCKQYPDAAGCSGNAGASAKDRDQAASHHLTPADPSWTSTCATKLARFHEMGIAKKTLKTDNSSK